LESQVMQQTAASTSAPHPSCRCKTQVGRVQRLAVSSRSVRRTTRHISTQAFGGAAAAFPGGYYDGGLSNIASAVGLVLAGLLTVKLVTEEGPPRDGAPECATCGGSGLEDCACRRWSDGDVGCSTCGGSGKSTCRSCNGGGTAVPIAAKVVKRNYSKFDLGGPK